MMQSNGALTSAQVLQGGCSGSCRNPPPPSRGNNGACPATRQWAGVVTVGEYVRAIGPGPPNTASEIFLHMGAGGWFHPNERESHQKTRAVYVAHSSDESVQRTKLGRKVEAGQGRSLDLQTR